jgi:pimeloyl-ACP methyl ester carboxylesterase
VSKIAVLVSGHRVVLLPGAVLPAEPAYAALLEMLGARVSAVAKDLEVYSADQPPLGFSLDMEVEGILREADVQGFDRFHLVGYSGGGASSLAFAALHGERLLSLALFEPAWAGNDRTPAEDAAARHPQRTFLNTGARHAHVLCRRRHQSRSWFESALSEPITPAASRSGRTDGGANAKTAV